MALLQNLKELLDKNNINYMQGNDENNNILLLPYMGIINKSNTVEICLEVYEDVNLLKFSFVKNRNKLKDLLELKSQLLDLNSTISNGTLAMKNDSDKIEYKTEVIITGDVCSLDTYRYHIRSCIEVYEELKKLSII